MSSYQTHVLITGSANEAFLKLTLMANWRTKDFEGSSTLSDEFIICHPGTHYAKNKVVEFIPGQKPVWLVTGGKPGWLKNQKEWTNPRKRSL
jgi:hypothetical protein